MSPPDNSNGKSVERPLRWQQLADMAADRDEDVAEKSLGPIWRGNSPTITWTPFPNNP
jgi:hypothetical protein